MRRALNWSPSMKGRNMKNRIFIYIAISLVFGGISYLLTNNFLYAGLILLVGLLIFIFIIEQLVSKYSKRMKKSQETYRFINSFIISLSASKSLEISFENALLDLEESERKILESLNEEGFEEKLEYLNGYFQSDIYKVFLSIIRLYQEEGGEILDIAGPLLRECTSLEEERITRDKNSTTALIRFSSLWLMSLLVMSVLRFGLSAFYESLIKNMMFILLILAYFVIAYGSFVIFAFALTKEKIDFKGVMKNERKKEKQQI